MMIMKKTLISFGFMILCGAISAQNFQDALLLSENDYQGTARTMAMGNAFTALGGDLGSIGINPAGSAVARYSQFTIPPGCDISFNGTKGIRMPDGIQNFEDKTFNANTRFIMPNYGFMLNFDTGFKRGIKNWSIGFVVNGSGIYHSNPYANGTNTATSQYGYLAVRAQDLAYDYGFVADDMLDDDIFNILPASEWNVVNAYRSGAIASIGSTGKDFIGISEYEDENGKIRMGEHGVEQSYGQSVTGTKYEYTFNAGMNISDVVYLGMNLSTVSANYTSNEFFNEKAVDPYDFDIIFTDNETAAETTTHFRSARSTFKVRSRANSFNAKFGIIVTPFSGLRIGAAIQTPAMAIVTNTYAAATEANYDVSSFSGSSDAESSDYQFYLRTPMRANFGIAWTIGQYGVVSADYEFSNYRKMHFSTADTYDQGNYQPENTEIRDLCGVGHNFRLGAEFRPVSSFAIRLGYNLLTSGQTHAYDGDSMYKLKLNEKAIHTASFGLGYSSNRSFFADLALVGQFHPMKYIRPYGDYIYDPDGIPAPYSPEIRYRSANLRIVATFGWRF